MSVHPGQKVKSTLPGPLTVRLTEPILVEQNTILGSIHEPLDNSDLLFNDLCDFIWHEGRLLKASKM
jgi:hypothetical protein